VARNRKRAKERRARRGDTVVTVRSERDNGAPTPIAHAAPDVELAEAQLALGRDPEAEADPEIEAELDEAAQNGELGEAEAIDVGTSPRASAEGRVGGPAVSRPGRVGEAAGHAPAAAAEERVGLPSRLVAFLQGCWRELQRVQWPDRRQVMQATGVVIGFVIIAGIFLGVADTVSSQIVKLILK
jgi:preprotein translocase subunit SecE